MTSESVPLFVDLDGTLIKNDLLVESVLMMLKRDPWCLFAMPYWFACGKARLKEEVAQRVTLDVDSLPLQTEFYNYLRNEAQRGRNLYLATASDYQLAAAVARRVGLFADILASDGRQNIKGKNKLYAILTHSGGAPFDYAGNERADLPIWVKALRGVVVNPGPGVATAARACCDIERIFDDRPPAWHSWIRAMRLYQWMKNLLVGVPLLTAHAFDLRAMATVVVAFVAFGLAASANYLLNDLLDLAADRRHPRKCERPIAAGDISLPSCLIGIVVLLVAALALAGSISWHFLLALLAYLALTLSYSWYFKKYMMIDVIMLASLYTMRIIAGAIAIHVVVSSWLLAFSMFTFLSLALVKRNSELIAMDRISRTDTAGRDYRYSDIAMLNAMGAAAGYLAVLVLALFVDSPGVRTHYTRPGLLWLLCPLMLYWVSRLWIKTVRGEMHDDPLVFSLRDRASWIIFLSMMLTTLAAV